MRRSRWIFTHALSDLKSRIIVDDVDAEHVRFEREKLSPGPLRDFKHDGKTLARFFFVADPDGYKIEVIQRGGRFG